MSFHPSGGSAGSISGSTDTALSNPADGQVLMYSAGVQKWQNGPVPSQSTATTSTYGTIKLAGDLAGTAAAPTLSATSNVNSIISNNSTVTANTSAIAAKAPLASPTFTGTVTLPSATPTATTQAATKGYVDTQIATVTSSGAPDATTTSNGIVRLAGDLAGTAAAPTLTATSNVNSIISNNATVSANTSAIANKAARGANSDITSLTGLTTALSVAQGGTGSTSASAALTALGALAASQKAAASGVASLDTNTLVPRAQLGTGTASSSTLLYGDGTWRTPAAQAVTTGYTWTAVKTSAYTASNGDAVICDASSAGFTITLPTTLGANAVVRVKKIDSTVNGVLVASSANIDGSASFVLNNQYASQDFSYTGTTWYAV